MATAAGALAPVFLIIALGWVLKRRGLPAAPFWPEAERLVYFLLLPALLFLTTAGSDLSGFRVLPVTLALIVAILATAAATLLIRPWLGLEDAAFTSVFQGAIRTNTYVGLAAAAALFGEAGLVVMGIVVLVVISVVNFLSVVVLVRFGRRGAAWRDAAGVIVRNPLILACLAGFAVNALGLPLPTIATATVDALGRASLALGLLCVGAGLELGRLAADRRAMVATCVLKLLLMPAATALTCRLFGVEGVTAAAAVLFNAVPISASSYILARQLDGDAPLMAALITATTIAAALTMPVVLTLVW
jgi:malonate transporter and related proteins